MATNCFRLNFLSLFLSFILIPNNSINSNIFTYDIYIISSPVGRRFGRLPLSGLTAYSVPGIYEVEQNRLPLLYFFGSFSLGGSRMAETAYLLVIGSVLALQPDRTTESRSGFFFYKRLLNAILHTLIK